MKKQICLFVFFICISLSAIANSNVPRFVSLRNKETNLRAGPGNRYPILWIYKEKGYPVEILDEYELWKQVREADGTIGWVHQSQISKIRHGVLLEETFLMNAPLRNARPVATVQKGTIGKILKCPEQSDYCLFDFTRAQGWLHKNSFFGVYPNEIID